MNKMMKNSARKLGLRQEQSAWTPGRQWFSDLFGDPCVSTCTHQHECTTNDRNCICNSNSLGQIWYCIDTACSLDDANDFMGEVKEWCDSRYGNSNWLTSSLVFGGGATPSHQVTGSRSVALPSSSSYRRTDLPTSSSSSASSSSAPVLSAAQSSRLNDVLAVSNTSGSRTTSSTINSEALSTDTQGGSIVPSSRVSDVPSDTAATPSSSSTTSASQNSNISQFTSATDLHLGADVGQESSSNLSGGAVAGISIGLLAVLISAFVLIWVCLRRRRQHQEEADLQHGGGKFVALASGASGADSRHAGGYGSMTQVSGHSAGLTSHTLSARDHYFEAKLEGEGEDAVLKIVGAPHNQHGTFLPPADASAHTVPDSRSAASQMATLALRGGIPTGSAGSATGIGSTPADDSSVEAVVRIPLQLLQLLQQRGPGSITSADGERILAEHAQSDPRIQAWLEAARSHALAPSELRWATEGQQTVAAIETRPNSVILADDPTHTTREDTSSSLHSDQLRSRRPTEATTPEAARMDDGFVMAEGPIAKDNAPHTHHPSNGTSAYLPSYGSTIGDPAYLTALVDAHIASRTGPSSAQSSKSAQ